jgi:hypothetical protein
MLTLNCSCSLNSFFCFVLNVSGGGDSTNNSGYPEATPPYSRHHNTSPFDQSQYSGSGYNYYPNQGNTLCIYISITSVKSLRLKIKLKKQFFRDKKINYNFFFFFFFFSFTFLKNLLLNSSKK